MKTLGNILAQEEIERKQRRTHCASMFNFYAASCGSWAGQARWSYEYAKRVGTRKPSYFALMQRQKAYERTIELRLLCLYWKQEWEKAAP